MQGFAQFLRGCVHPGNNGMHVSYEKCVLTRAFSQRVTKSYNMGIKASSSGLFGSVVGFIVADCFLSQLRVASQEGMTFKSMTFGFDEDYGIRSSMQELPVHDMPKVSIGAQVEVPSQRLMLQGFTNRQGQPCRESRDVARKPILYPPSSIEGGSRINGKTTS